MNEPIIELHQVVKKYNGKASSVTALKGIDLRISAGEFVAVLGKSGAGKTTLVNLISGIDQPTSGEIHVAGTAVQALNEDARAAWRGRNVGVVFQFFQLLPTLTAVENVMLPMDFGKRYAPAERYERALRLLEQVDMAEHAHKLPLSLSGGQQQSIAIARALACDPPLLAADEPTGNLDSQTANVVWQLFEQLVDGGKTILMVTHDNDLAQRARRTVVMADGKIVDEQLNR